MQDLPHHYAVSANGRGDGNVIISSAGVDDIETAGPPEFGGPGDVWSPETLLVGTIANCFVLTFRAVARAAKLEWTSLTCDVVGTLDKIERATQFTDFDIRAELVVARGTEEAKALRLMEKAEQHCLITNSMKAPAHLTASVRKDEAPVAANL